MLGHSQQLGTPPTSCSNTPVLDHNKLEVQTPPVKRNWQRSFDDDETCSTTSTMTISPRDDTSCSSSSSLSSQAIIIGNQDLLRAMLNYLKHLVTLSTIESSTTVTKQFMGNQVPPICMDKYLTRLCKYINIACQEKEEFMEGSSGVKCLIGGLVFLTRLVSEHSLQINARNIHRLVLSCTLVAFKILEDESVGNAYWSLLGDVPTQEVNGLERALCTILDYRMNLHEDEMNNVVNCLYICL